MKQIAWLTDIHLNFLSIQQLRDFIQSLNSDDINEILISGDIGEAPTLIWFLEFFEQLEKPVYFVLGNHDFYFSSFGRVKSGISRLNQDSIWLNWLTESDVVELSSTTGLIGHDSWADGRYGDFINSPIILNDYILIGDFNGLDLHERLDKLHELGDEAAHYFEKVLPKALDRYEHVYLVTHVPPFIEATRHRGRVSSEDYLPHYSCQAVGAVLVKVMCDYPDHQLTVLCGHTHGEARVQMMDNLLVLTGGTEYGSPRIIKMFEVE